MSYCPVSEDVKLELVFQNRFRRTLHTKSNIIYDV